jgi:hypothetical protein
MTVLCHWQLHLWVWVWVWTATSIAMAGNNRWFGERWTALLASSGAAVPAAFHD